MSSWSKEWGKEIFNLQMFNKRIINETTWNEIRDFQVKGGEEGKSLDCKKSENC